MYVCIYVQYLLIYLSSYLRIEENNAVGNNVSSVRSKNFYLLGDTICLDFSFWLRNCQHHVHSHARFTKNYSRKQIYLRVRRSGSSLNQLYALYPSHIFSFRKFPMSISPSRAVPLASFPAIVQVWYDCSLPRQSCW